MGRFEHRAVSRLQRPERRSGPEEERSVRRDRKTGPGAGAVQEEVGADSEKREEADEADQDPGRSTKVLLLLLEEVRGGHEAGSADEIPAPIAGGRSSRPSERLSPRAP